LDSIKTKNKAAPLKPFQVKNQMFLFINSLIENPTFDSQTKENMTLRVNAFGSKCDLTDDFKKKVLKSGIVDTVLSFAQFTQEKLLKKSDGHKTSRISGIPKLDDANNAGTKNSKNCTLILTEGDSAKALAVAGLSVVGRDNFGIFPLRGKLITLKFNT
jgi:DNA topoisomerase-2